MYEGRTRGKKLKYTYSDDEDIFSDEQPSRRSARNTSSNVAAPEPRTRFTASGRQIRSRAGGLYGETLLTGQREDSEEEEEDTARPQRARTSTNPNGYSGYAADDLEDESEAHSSANESGNEWQSGDDENEVEGDDEAEITSGDESITKGEPQSLVVQLRVGKINVPSEHKPSDDEPPPSKDVQMKDVSVGVPPTSQPTTDRAPTQARSPQQVLKASVIAEPSVPSDPKTQETNLPITASASSMPSVPTVETPKSMQPVEPNGWSRDSTGTESRPGPGLPQPQAPTTQG